MPLQPRRAHLYDVDCAKGLVIPLVVFTHLTLRGDPAGNEWYTIIRNALGGFEMPMFMYLSGLVMFYTDSAFVTPRKYPSYLFRRGQRFMLPYIAIALAILFGKVVASHLIFVDNKPSDLITGIISMFWNTGASPASSMWYIFVMFVYCLLVPPMMWITRGRVWPLVVLGILIYPLPWPDYVFLNKIGHFFIFFILGGLAATRLKDYLAFIDTWGVAFLILFIMSLPISVTDMHWLVRTAITGTLSLPALHFLVRQPGIYRSPLLMFLGFYCFVIYLFNTIFIGVTKGVMFHIMSWDGPNFLIFAPILFLAGILGPVLLKKLVFKRRKFLDTITA